MRAETASGFDWRPWVQALLSLGVFAAVLYVIHREVGHLHLHDIRVQLHAIPPRAVGGAIALTACSYFLLSFYDVLGLKYVGKSLPFYRVAFASFLAYAISHNLGAAALTGGAIRYRIYSASGLTGIEVATLQGFCSTTTVIGLGVLAGASLLLAPHNAAAALHLLQPWTSLIGAAILLLVAGYIAWASLAPRGVDLRGWVLRPPGASIATAQVIVGVLELSASAGVLWALFPAEANVGFAAFVGAYALAVAAGIASHIPGGLGVFEFIMLITLPHVHADALLGSLVAYRLVYYLLPLVLAGASFAAREVAAQRNRLAWLERLVATYVAPVVPQFAGTMVFVAGLVLLFSGATPAIDTRLAALRALVPLPILETSHLLGSVAGLGLVILSRSLFRRVREGYRVTVWLLIAGIAASLLKGLDFEEATLLAIVLLVLWLGRRAFHRRASLIGERFTPAWIVSIAGAIGAAIWVGFFAHKHVEYSNDLWWTFAASADAPRMLRASLTTMLCAGTFLVLNLLRPARPEPRNAAAAELEQARSAICHSDTTLANAAWSEDKRLLFAPQGDAFIMYQTMRRSWIALGDPVGPRARHEELVWTFRELADRHDGWTVFYQASASRLPLYVDIGLTPVKIGEEARVPLEDFSLAGSARADLRQSHRRAERFGSTFEVVERENSEALLPKLRRISDAWLEEKAIGEKRFSVGAFSELYIRRFPLAIVRCEGDPVAFANVWTTANRSELSVDLMRFGPDAPSGSMDFLFTELMLWGRAQGYKYFNLGMAPLAGLEQHPLATAWHRLGNFIFRHGEHFYNFDGLRRYKAKFNPEWEARYLVAPGGLLVLPRVLIDVSALIAGGVRGLPPR